MSIDLWFHIIYAYFFSHNFQENLFFSIFSNSNFRNFMFGLLNKNQQGPSNITIEVISTTCDPNHLTIAAAGCITTDTFIQCTLLTNEVDGTMRKCTFNCQCISSCTSVSMSLHAFGTESQEVCEIKLL